MLSNVTWARTGSRLSEGQYCQEGKEMRQVVWCEGRVKGWRTKGLNNVIRRDSDDDLFSRHLHLGISVRYPTGCF